MAQLDRLLSAMVQQRADAILLHEGEVGRMLVLGEPKPLTRAPLTPAQIASLLKEIAAPDDQALIAAGRDATFRYDNDDGAFGVKLRIADGKWACTIEIDDFGEFERMTGMYRVVATPATEAATNGGASASPASAEPEAPTEVTAEQPAPAAAEAPPAPSPQPPAVPPAIAAAPPYPVPAALLEAAKAKIDELLTILVTKGGSDLHLRVEEPPVIRLHGEMIRLEGHEPLTPDGLLHMLVSIMPLRNQHEFRERNDSDYAYEIEGVARFRANAMRERKGAAAVFRVIPATVVSVEQMQVTQEVQNLCYLTKGLVLVTGPTGSGKSTTLCSLIDLVNRSRSDHVITIEDPIEFVHPNKKCIITQRQVGVHTDSFKSALRAALREDPDVILVGELRDLETTAIAIETAETGHLVFGTLHTTTAAGTIDRIIDQFPADRQEQIRTMLSESLKGVVSQTLCKKIGGGRVAVREIMLHTPALANLIREGKTFQIPSMIQTSRRLGMVLLNDSMLEKVEQKLVEPKEAYTKVVDKAGFAQMLKSGGFDTSFLEAEDDSAGKKGPGGPQRPGAPARR
ncbi:MAG: type IV pilus twitching motility protein PilT [Gemmatimonadales bacterium]|nr:type IV pilus twitching motility protein PilT [Gemmatimonadales bacterium]